MDWAIFVSTFALIFVAELPDRTAFATLLMAARGPALPVFFGAAMAFLVQSIVAVTLGKYIGLLDHFWVQIAAGALFLVFAVLEWRKSREKHDELSEAGEEQSPADLSILRRFFAAFMTIFIAEWGDMTQLATAGIAAQTGALLTVFCAATLALWSVTAVAVVVGHNLKKQLPVVRLQQVASIAFLCIGGFLLIQALATRF